MKPMLAATIDDVATLRYPLMASPKLDGIRCLIVDGVPVSRNFKPIPNLFISKRLRGLPPFDGELIVGDPKAADCFNKSSSGVMSHDGEPKFTFWVFDNYKANMPFKDRYESVRQLIKKEDMRSVLFVAHKMINTPEELLRYESQMVIAGYEGIMVRDPLGPYKHGRATLREGYLSKLKRFADGEAEIVGFEEQMENTNEQIRDELGRSKRSSAKVGQVPKGTLGALAVRDLENGVHFDIGTGFDDATRAAIWLTRGKLLGAIVKYKHQPVGQVNKPRFPVFIGFRNKIDL